MFGTYIDNCFRICIVMLIADLVYRLYLCYSEYKNYINRYLPPNRILNIFNRCFSFSSAWKIYFVALLLVATFRISVTRKNPLVIGDFLYMPLYWIFRLLQFPHSNLDYAKWIRAPYGLDYGEGMASSYFHGYLKLIMPSHTGHSGIRERIASYSNIEKVEFITDRLVILIPNIMYVSPKIESKILERRKPLETVIKNRAGVHRPYKNDVYRFTEKIMNDKFYYIAMEGATPLLTFFEGRDSTWQTREFQREILFKFSQSLRKMVNNYPGLQNDIEIIFYNATMGNGDPQDVGEVLKAHFRKTKKKKI